MKPEFYIDFPAGQQHTLRYFRLQGSSPGFNPPVSSGLFDDPELADRRGTRTVGQNKASCRCPHRSAMRRGAEKAGKILPRLLELLLRLEGDIRRRLSPIRVTPSQAGVILFLRRHAEARVTDAATALGVRLLTLSVMVKVLVRKRWVTKRCSVTVTRVVHLRLSRRGNALALQIEQRVRQVNATLAEQDRRTLGMNPKGSHA